MTREKIAAILRTMSSNDSRCQGASQQMTNGFYRGVEMLALFIRYLDKDGAYNGEVAAIETTHMKNESFCQSAPQQSANGVYRVVEMLEVLVKVVAPSKSSEAAAVLANMARNESFCQSAPQQIANGSYRMAEMLCALVSGCDASLADRAESIISGMNRNESFCQGAPQQSANGMDASALLVELLARKVDVKGAYESRLDSIVRIKQSNNSRCQGADQQSGNYLYRMLEMGQVIADVFMDEEEALAAKRLADYWMEHAEEKIRMLGEKDELSLKVADVMNRAAAINDEEHIQPLRAVIEELKKKQAAVCNPEIQNVEAAIAAKNAEKAPLSLFAFSQRKAINAQIEVLKARKMEEERVVQIQKDNIGAEIHGVENQIKGLEAEVERKREAVRKEAVPYESRIREIDYELTRPR